MKKKVLVGLSGGLDSTIAALLLQQQGYEVIGVHFQLWHDDTAPSKEKNLPENKCCSLKDLMLARTVAKKLKIPFFVFDFRDRFKKEVVDDFIAKFKQGITPNPCVECNRHIKFGLFLEKMKELNCDFVATGHYVKNTWNEQKKQWELSSGKDASKDQTYFLYTLTQEKLAHCLFPMEKYNKNEVRELARQNGLEIFAEKPESQGVCFYAEKSHLPFLKRKIPEAFKSGEIREIETQKIIGNHTGILQYTKGQRARVGGLLTPQYVIRTDITKNTVYIGPNELLWSKKITLQQCSWTTCRPENQASILVKIRHGGQLVPARFHYENEIYSLELSEKIRSITPGQSAVLYDENGMCLGGGIIKE